MTLHVNTLFNKHKYIGTIEDLHQKAETNMKTNWHSVLKVTALTIRGCSLLRESRFAADPLAKSLGVGGSPLLAVSCEGLQLLTTV